MSCIVTLATLLFRILVVFFFFPPLTSALSLFFHPSSPRSSAAVYFPFLSDNYIFDKQRITFPLKVVRAGAVERGI